MLAAMERHGIRKTEPKSEEFDYDLLKAVPQMGPEVTTPAAGARKLQRMLYELSGRARAFRRGAKHSTLLLNPDLNVPRYQTAVDIHLMPGSYYTDRAEDDVTAGAIYDPASTCSRWGQWAPTT